ncbi:hypothetical protein [Sphingobacterium thalpophilum]|uniref:hypothetical protein n=1 Tax=Sphingobacterium thalpophilum TaxID=259 RepID=UPI0024A691FF|nr:hypothetical protein [Sphingobacterium thalpophilum]
MIRYFASMIWAFLVLQACNTSTTERKTVATSKSDSLDSLAPNVNRSVRAPVKADISAGQIFLVRSYRIWEGDPTAVLNKDWFDLYEQDGKYFLDKVDYVLRDGFDECAQVATKNVESKRNSLLFLKINGLKPGIVEHVAIRHAEIWPKESVEYRFRNQLITLKASGDIKSTQVQSDENEHEKLFHEVANYQLGYQLQGQQKEMVIFRKEQFDGVFMTTLFAGDIDADGQLDFVFSNPGNYEEESILLLLSNHGNPKIYEADEQFDC